MDDLIHGVSSGLHYALLSQAVDYLLERNVIRKYLHILDTMLCRIFSFAPIVLLQLLQIWLATIPLRSPIMLLALALDNRILFIMQMDKEINSKTTAADTD